MSSTSSKIDHAILGRKAKQGSVYTYYLHFIDQKEGVSRGVMHTLEYCLAASLRSEAVFGNNILYVGPMGCSTGFYILLNKEVEFPIIAFYLRKAFEYVLTVEDISYDDDCQYDVDYICDDLDGAKELSIKMIGVFMEGAYNTLYPVF